MNRQTVEVEAFEVEAFEPSKVFDIRDAIQRFEYLESRPEKDEDEEEEYSRLESLLDDTKGNGGDEEWRDAWYPATFIRDDYFTEYAEELVKDCGYIARGFPSWIDIDWESTAENVKQDYSSIYVCDMEYWYR